MNQQPDEEMHRAKDGEGVQGIHTLSRGYHSPRTLPAQRPRSSPNPVLPGFMEASLHRLD